MGAPALLGGEHLGGASGRRGLGGAALLLAEHGEGEAQSAEPLEGLQELAGVGPADELHAA